MEMENKNIIYFTKIREVKSPVRANSHDAGIDFFIPKLDEQFWKDFMDKNPQYQSEPSDCITILPGERVLIPSGIKVWINPKESALIAANKSGLASKRGLVFTAEVVDADYTGEVHIGILNTSSEKYNMGNATHYLYGGDKAIQFVHTPVILSNMTEINQVQYFELTCSSDRGEGGFGSTDKQ